LKIKTYGYKKTIYKTSVFRVQKDKLLYSQIKKNG